MKTALIWLVAAFLPAQNSSSAPAGKPAYEAIEVVLARVPRNARAKNNPFETDPQAPLAGKKLFEQHCAECHGDSAGGSRRGPALTGALLAQANGGDIFWIMTNGVVRRGMPAWSKLPEAQRWQIVVFLKSLKVAPEKEPQ